MDYFLISVDFKKLGKSQNATDGHTDRKMDGQPENSFLPSNKVCLGLIKVIWISPIQLHRKAYLPLKHIPRTKE